MGKVINNINYLLTNSNLLTESLWRQIVEWLRTMLTLIVFLLWRWLSELAGRHLECADKDDSSVGTTDICTQHLEYVPP